MAICERLLITWTLELELDVKRDRKELRLGSIRQLCGLRKNHQTSWLAISSFTSWASKRPLQEVVSIK